MAPIEEKPALALERRPVALPVLYEVEESLLALLDTTDLVTPEMEEEFLKDLGESLQTAVTKRDRVAGFIKFCDSIVECAKAERERLRLREKQAEAAGERARKYVAWVIEALGPDTGRKQKADGSFPLRILRGKLFSMYTMACQPSLEITDEKQIPRRYYDVTLTGPAEVMDKILLKVIEEFGRIEPLTGNATVNTAAVKKALEAGEDVPGAELIVGKLALVVK